MEKISLNNAIKGENSNKCKTLEYQFNSKQMDLGIATITGRYPDHGYCANMISEELVYVIDGSGKLYQGGDHFIEFKKGDAILINNNEKYYWESDYCVVSLTCTPAWVPEQHKTFE